MDFTGKVAWSPAGATASAARPAWASPPMAPRWWWSIATERRPKRPPASSARTAARRLAVTADVTKSDDVKAYVKAAIDKYGRIDCFFNNAGIEGKVAPTAEYDEAMFDAVIGVNVKGVFLGLRHVLPEMIRRAAARWSTRPRSPGWSARRACRPMSPRSTPCSG